MSTWKFGRQHRRLYLTLYFAHEPCVYGCFDLPCRFDEVMISEYTATMARKMGLVAYNKDLSVGLMRMMHKDETDFTNTFRALSSVTTVEPEGGDDAQISPELVAVIGSVSDDRKIAWKEWIASYRKTLQNEGLDESERMAMQNATNPKYIPRQHLLQWAIEEAEKGDFSELERLMKVVVNPFDEIDGMDKYCQPPPEDLVKPGVCILSCSS